MAIQTAFVPAWLRKFGQVTKAIFTKPRPDILSPFPQPPTFIRKVIMAHLNWDNVLGPMYNEFMAGPENEHNWLRRQTSIRDLKHLLLSNKPDIPKNFWDKMKHILPCVVNSAASERTQLSKDACELIGTMFQTLGSGMHPYVESIIPTIMNICGSTKKQNQINGNNTMITIIQFSGYNRSLLNHICNVFKDKRKEARANGPAWLTQYLEIYKHALDPTRDYPAIGAAVVAGLGDGDVKTREASRKTFWRYAEINQPATDEIMADLNSHAATALKADKHNPNKTSGPARPARPESALAKIKAQKAKVVAGQPSTEARRDFSNHSISSEMPFPASLDRIDDPPEKWNPNKVIHPHAKLNLIATHKKLVANSTRSENTPIFEIMQEERMIKPPRLGFGPSYGPAGETTEPRAEQNEVDNSTNARPFLSAPVRRPRVVATPINQSSHQPQPQPTSRPTSRGDPAKSAETRERAQSGKSGRQTPVIHEAKGSRPRLHPPTKSERVPARTEHKGALHSSTSSRPTSSSSEPAGVKSPRGHLQQSASVNILPTRHQKQSSQSEVKGHRSVASPAISSADDGRLQPKSPFDPVLPPNSLSDTLATSVSPGEKQVHHAVSHTKSKSEAAIIPSPAKENANQPTYSKDVTDEALNKARRSLPNITEALKEGKLDALGYRKLRKLIMTYPGQLFTGVEFDEQYDALYRALISQFSIEDLIEARDLKRANQNHPMYTRMAVIDMLQLLMMQYPYGEPEPGMTLVALLVAKLNHNPSRIQVEDKIRSSMLFYLQDTCNRWNPLPVIDSLTDALLELQDVIESEDPDTVLTPTWSKVLNSVTIPSFLKEMDGSGITSYNVAFKDAPPSTRASRLPGVMEVGILLLTGLINDARLLGHQLFEVQQERLVGLLTIAINEYRQLYKKTVMEFATALYDIISPKERFDALFGEDSDLNLVHYCIEKVKGRKLSGNGNGNGMGEGELTVDELATL